MNGNDLPPSTFTLRECADWYDQCVAVVIAAQQEGDDDAAAMLLSSSNAAAAKLLLVCRILLATRQLSEAQSTIVDETKERCAAMLVGKEEENSARFLKSNQVAVEREPSSSGKWSWKFEKEHQGDESDDDGNNLLCLDQEELEREEQELVWMANAPIPSAGKPRA